MKSKEEIAKIIDEAFEDVPKEVLQNLSQKEIFAAGYGLGRVDAYIDALELINKTKAKKEKELVEGQSLQTG